jgi:hypothetical protein
MKQLNIILYIPGYAGKFCQSLLSLHETTYPHYPINIPDSIIAPSNVRAEWYSYKDLYSKHSNWKNYHAQFNNEIDDKLYYNFLSSNYNHLTVSVHPVEFYYMPPHSRFEKKPNYIVQQIIQNKNYIRAPFKGTKYAQVISTVDKNSEFVKLFIQKNNNFPVIRDNEFELHNQFTKDFNPHIINYENLCAGEETFLLEYTNLTNYFEMPIQIDLALSLYRDWIVSRNSSP